MDTAGTPSPRCFWIPSSWPSRSTATPQHVKTDSRLLPFLRNVPSFLYTSKDSFLRRLFHKAKKASACSTALLGSYSFLHLASPLETLGIGSHPSRYTWRLLKQDSSLLVQVGPMVHVGETFYTWFSRSLPHLVFYFIFIFYILAVLKLLGDIFNIAPGICFYSVVLFW